MSVTKVIQADGCKSAVDGLNFALRRVAEYYGLSGDPKPTDARNADVFYEMDTQKVYLYNEVGKVWLVQ